MAGVGAGDGLSDGDQTFFFQFPDVVAAFFQEFAQFQAQLEVSGPVQFADAGFDGGNVADQAQNLPAVLCFRNGV